MTSAPFATFPPGRRLEPMDVEVTAAMVIGGALASRDWAPQHHDHLWASGPAGLCSVIMNTPTQLGLLCRYATDRLGWTARVLRLSCHMKRPISPGDVLAIHGDVVSSAQVHGIGVRVALAVAFERQGRGVTEGSITLGVPYAGREREAWQLSAETWLGVKE